MERAYIRQGDQTTAGGVVLDGLAGMEDCGRQLSYLYAKVWCPVCRTEGFIAPCGKRPDDELMGKPSALHLDICECQCEPKPRVIASQSDMVAWV
jgi:PAAR motif-containing protein